MKVKKTKGKGWAVYSGRKIVGIGTTKKRAIKRAEYIIGSKIPLKKRKR